MAVAVYTSLLTLDEAPSGTVTVQDAGTTTLRAIFTNTGLSIAATNPIPLDSSGRATQGIIYTAAGAYKVIVKNSAGTTLYTRDNIDPGVPIGSGALAIANGGTSATSAPAALAALGGATAAELADVAADVAALSGSLASTEKTHIATGTTAQRTSSPAAGDIRNNTTTVKYEAYVGADWDNFMFEAANAASTANVTAETTGALFIRADRLKYSDRVAKAWAHISWSGGTPSLTDGFNISGTITDNGTGDITVSFSTALPDAEYCVVATSRGGSSRIVTVTTQSTTQIRFAIESGGVAVDPGGIGFVVFGDFA